MTAHGPLVKIPETRALHVAERCQQLPASAIKLLTPEMSPAEFAGVLQNSKQFVAGIEFMAHALPAREAVWWACLAIEHALGESLAGANKEACRAAVQWVLKPTEENRIAARAPAELAGPASPAGAAALAASLGTAPSAFPAPRAVCNSVKLCSIRSNPARIADTQRLYVDLAIEIGQGRYM